MHTHPHTHSQTHRNVTANMIELLVAMQIASSHRASCTNTTTRQNANEIERRKKQQLAQHAHHIMVTQHIYIALSIDKMRIERINDKANK